MTDGRRDRLLSLIRKDGILRASETQSILGRTGQRGQWMLYLWPITMTADGLAEVAEEMLRLVQPFEATQIAANGFGAVPMMAAMVRAGGGRYSGLVIRPQAKAHGALRRIDGRGDRSQSVVIVDDSISSGTSFRQACIALEDEGYIVEGTACLVDFSSRGGRERAEALGYRVETSFDIWRDLGMKGPDPIPGFVSNTPSIWSRERLPDGLHPAVAARRVAEHFLATGEALRPPACFDGPEDDSGGAFVSLRRRRDDFRLARKGFWHFDPADADPCRDVVIATVQTLRSFRRPLTRSVLDELKIGVTFFGPLERVAANELDFFRYGVVVRSRVVPKKMGGALPNTQYFTSTYEQYRHARWTNAKIFDLEDHDIFRHELVKRVEPGESWLPYGEDQRLTDAWLGEPRLGDRLLDRAVEVIDALKRGVESPATSALPADLLTHEIAAVGVTLFDRGVQGCSVARAASIDEALVRAAKGALGDKRFAARRAASSGSTSCSVSLLHSQERLGVLPIERAAKKFRRGRDSISVHQADRSAVYLDSVVVHHDWTKEHAAEALLMKAGITTGPVSWSTYKTTSWVRSPEGTFQLEGGNCQHAPGQAITEADLSLLAHHLVRRLDLDGWPAYSVRALQGSYVRQGTAARCLHALRLLDDAGRFGGIEEWRTAARRGVEYALSGLSCTPVPSLAIRDHTGGAAAEACLLGAIASTRHDSLDSVEVRALAAKLRSSIGPDGCVLSPGVTKSRADADFLPGITLFNLATYGLAIDDDLGLDWVAIRAWYMRRARLVHPWGLMAWQSQVWNLVGDLTGDPSHHETALELSDSMVEGQLRVDGSFLTDMSATGPGFQTAFVAEGIAAGWRSAIALGDQNRAKRFEGSWEAAMVYTDQLLFRREDAYWTPEPTIVVGGIRSNPTSSALRVDFTSHTIQALLGGLRASRLSS